MTENVCEIILKFINCGKFYSNKNNFINNHQFNKLINYTSLTVLTNFLK